MIPAFSLPLLRLSRCRITVTILAKRIILTVGDSFYRALCGDAVRKYYEYLAPPPPFLPPLVECASEFFSGEQQVYFVDMALVLTLLWPYRELLY